MILNEIEGEKTVKIEQWRVKQGLSYENLGRKLNLTTSKIYRICKQDPCIRLHDAHKIVSLTQGAVGYEELLVEGC